MSRTSRTQTLKTNPHWPGGQLASANAEHEPSSGCSNRTTHQSHCRTVRGVARATSALAFGGAARMEPTAHGMAASNASHYPQRTPKAKADEAPPRQPWQPASCGGGRTSNVESKSTGVYRPGQGAGHPCGHPKTARKSSNQGPQRASLHTVDRCIKHGFTRLTL